jgi:transcriptional regulator with XRE-family HTH domain
MTERFKTLLDQLKLSPSEFAEQIGVQRSSISHILSGRNKPSIDFLEKILNVYPDTDVYWLITGNPSPKKEVITPLIDPLNERVVSDSEQEVPYHKKETPVLDEPEPVDQIIIVYKNKTFRILNPSEK